MTLLSFSILIHVHVQGATPIKEPFDHCVHSNKNHLLALKLFSRGAYIGIFTVASYTEEKNAVSLDIDHDGDCHTSEIAREARLVCIMTDSIN